MTHIRTSLVLAILALALCGTVQPAEAQLANMFIMIKIADEPSVGGTALGGASGTINGTPISIPEKSWADTHSQKSPLFEGGVGFPAGRSADIVALVNYGRAEGNGKTVGDLAGTPVTAIIDNYTFWGMEGGAHLRTPSGVGPYGRITAGFRHVSAIGVGLTTISLTSASPVYSASIVPTFAFGGGFLFGDRGTAFGIEVDVRYAGPPSAASGQTLVPASGAGARWSLPIALVVKF
jgi:hypothetical protein